MFTDLFKEKEWERYSKTTANATKTTVKTISVPEGNTVFVQMEVTGQKSDASKGGAWKLAAIFKRVASGDITQEGTTNSIYTQGTSGLTADCNIEADTSTQTAICTVTGIAAQTWNWTIKVRYQYS